MTFDEWLDDRKMRAHLRRDREYLNLLKLVRAQRQTLAVAEDYGGLPHEGKLRDRLEAEIAALEAALMGEKCST